MPAVAALTVSVAGMIFAKEGWVRFSLLPIVILSGMLVLTHRLILG